MEETIFGLISHSGDAKSLLMEAIGEAKEGEFEKAKKKIEAASEKLNLAHQVQTSLIQSEAGGEKQEASLLLIHAQDHLMNAILLKDLATEFIDLYKKIEK